MAVLVIDKPVGPSSFQVVRHVRRSLGRLWGVRSLRTLKVGHGGTLDPAASGVLPICVGEGTKLAPFLLDADKSYEATVQFGVETDTLDATGTVVATSALDGLDGDRVLALLGQFRGAIQQVPPMYSALKRDGRPLYAYAREGQEVVREARALTIHELTLVEWLPPATARLHIRCSKGTYVRTLAADLGRAAGPGAHLTGLRRTASGPFHLGQATGLADLDQRIAAGDPLPWIDLADALAHLPAVTVDQDKVLPLTQGKRVPSAELGAPAGPSDTGGPIGPNGPTGPNRAARPARQRLLRPDGSLLAVADLTGEFVRFERVFSAEPAHGGNATGLNPIENRVTGAAGLAGADNVGPGSFSTGLLPETGPSMQFSRRSG